MFIKDMIARVSAENMKNDLFYLCRDPLPFRTVLYHRPWQERSSLQETDDFIVDRVKKLGIEVNVYTNKVRPFRCNPAKPLHHWYSAPHEDDPWYDAANVSGGTGQQSAAVSKQLTEWILQVISSPAVVRRFCA